MTFGFVIRAASILHWPSDFLTVATSDVTTEISVSVARSVSSGSNNSLSLDAISGASFSTALQLLYIALIVKQETIG